MFVSHAPSLFAFPPLRLLHMPPSGVGGELWVFFFLFSLVYIYPPVLSFFLLEIRYHISEYAPGWAVVFLFFELGAFVNGRLHVLGEDFIRLE